MRVYVQWAQTDSPWWAVYDVASSAELPSKPEPTGSETLDNTPGWVTRIHIPGIGGTSGFDHVAFDTINGETHFWAWNDDPTDWPVGERFGYHRVSGMRDVWYADPHWNSYPLIQEGGVLYPFEDFPTPTTALVRHGIWLPDWLWEAHRVTLGAGPDLWGFDG